LAAAGFGAALILGVGRTRPLTAEAAIRYESDGGVIADVLEILTDDAHTRRQARMTVDSDYGRRVDGALNGGRINVLLYGYGESHEPPSTEHVVIGSITIVSIGAQDPTVDLVSLTHDIRAPEIERYLLATGIYDGKAVRIDQAYPVGGFALTRETLEDATGLAIDYQLAFDDSFIVDFIDQLFGTIVADVPRIDANPLPPCQTRCATPQ
jgi:anionic cell wall polymer biosynthesis LytR-Cps2A-Psr (LCP) family protein